MHATAIKTKNLNIGYPTVKERLLEDVNLTVKYGQVIAIIGPNGSGKSCLLRTLGLLIPAISGQLFIDKEELDCAALPRAEQDQIIKQYFAFVLQPITLMNNWTVEENIAIPLIAQGEPPFETEQKINEYSQLVQVLGNEGDKKTSLETLKQTATNRLSGGQRHLTAISMAFAKKPKILIADEPTTNLDTQHSELIIDKIIKLAKKQQAAVILSTHDPAIQEHCEHVYEIKDKTLFYCPLGNL